MEISSPKSPGGMTKKAVSYSSFAVASTPPIDNSLNTNKASVMQTFARSKSMIGEEATAKDRKVMGDVMKAAKILGNDKTVYQRTLDLARRLRDPALSLTEFHTACNDTFHELRYFGHLDGIEVTDEKGQPGEEEYWRTLNALDNVYHFLRLDLEGESSGKITMVFGDTYQAALRRKEVGVKEGEEEAAKWDNRQWAFMDSFEADGGWKFLSQLVKASGMQDDDEVVAAMLVLSAIHDIFKITALKPADEADHDMALKACLLGQDGRSWLTPSFTHLPDDLKELLIATTEGYNHGWFVQAETSVAVALPELTIFDREQLIAFYALHWISDVGGVNHKNFGGSSAWLIWARFGSSAFLPMVQAFDMLSRSVTEVCGHERAYLEWIKHCYITYVPGKGLPMGRDTIVRMRLAAMAQSHAPLVETVWANHSILTTADKEVLSFEFALTGIDGHFFDPSEALNYGPVFSLKFVPQYIREHCEDGAHECAGALHNLAEILRMLRNEHPVKPTHAGVNVDAILRLVGKGKGDYHRAGGVNGFELCPVHQLQYEVLHKDSLDDEPSSPGPSIGHGRAAPAAPDLQLRAKPLFPGRTSQSQQHTFRRASSLGHIPLNESEFWASDGKRSFPSGAYALGARRPSINTVTPKRPVLFSQPSTGPTQDPPLLSEREQPAPNHPASVSPGLLRRSSVERCNESRDAEDPSVSQSSASPVGHASAIKPVLEELHILVKGDGQGRKPRRINLPRSTSVSELRAVLGKLVGAAAEVAEAEYWDPEFEEWCELPSHDLQWGTPLPMFPSSCRVRIV